VVSERYFVVPGDLLEQLRNLRASRPADEIESTHDAFLLDPGLGPPTYLAADGRILWDDDSWGVEPTRGEAYAAIVVGARKTGLRDLLRLLPPRPPGTPDCGECNGTGRLAAGLCSACRGVGWRAAH
jgi:hypothetical protein